MIKQRIKRKQIGNSINVKNAYKYKKENKGKEVRQKKKRKRKMNE